jgi:hypothetical protein
MKDFCFMDISTACRILGIETNASLAEVESAKRKLLQALHPDKHPPEQREIFGKVTRDIIEAADFLKEAISLSGSHPRNSEDSTLEQILYDESRGRGKHRGPVSKSKDLVIYEKRYDSDKVLAVAIISIDYVFQWISTSRFTGQSEFCRGCKLNLRMMNRTGKAIRDLHVGRGVLIDNRGHQYSSTDGFFCWATEDGQFNKHSDLIAPSAKIEGFVLFPSLRKGSKEFVRWFLGESFRVGEEWHKGSYDVHLT